MDLQEVLLRLLKAELHVGSSVILWREIIGNGFGLASALLGMWRKVAAWPVGVSRWARPASDARTAASTAHQMCGRAAPSASAMVTRSGPPTPVACAT